MPDNALVVLENQLKPLAPRFADVLGKTMPVERLIRTVIVSVERTPKLLNCDRQSLFNAAMSAACLGLEVDGVTGQAFLIPYGDKAQLVIGYKGFNTLAARSGYTITGGVVREGDDVWDYMQGSGAFVKHKPKLGNKGRIIASWSCAEATGRPPIVAVLSIDDIMAIKAKSPGARKSDSPWNDTAIGFPAMGEKSAKRRLARSMPLNVMQLAARLDEAFEEQGKSAYITPDKGLVIDGEYSPIAAREESPTPTAAQLISPGNAAPATAAPSSTANASGGAAEPIPEWGEYVDRWATTMTDATDAKVLADQWNGQKDLRKKITWPDPAGRDGDVFAELKTRVLAKIDALKKVPA